MKRSTRIAAGWILALSLLLACSPALQQEGETPISDASGSTTEEAGVPDQMGPGMRGATQIPAMGPPTQMPSVG